MPLVRACENKIPVLPIYLIEPSFWKQPFSSKRHWSFIRDCLIDLQRDLISLRSKLHVEIEEALNFFDEINKKFTICSILSHEETGNKSIYCSKPHTINIKGWTRDESLAIFRFLTKHLTKDEFVTRFKWQPGSLAMWDNRCMFHNALNDYQGHRRHMHRVIVKGDRPQ